MANMDIESRSRKLLKPLRHHKEIDRESVGNNNNNEEILPHKRLEHKKGRYHKKNKVKSQEVDDNNFEDSYDDDDGADDVRDATASDSLASSDESNERTSELNLHADNLNNTKKADVDLIIFNRVPKVGSQSLMQLLTTLGKLNGFTTSRDISKGHETVLIEPRKQRELALELLAKPKPHAYNQHLAYINFTRFHLPKPIYINLVRHPIERIISWHYYTRAEWYYQDLKEKMGHLAPLRPSDEFMNLDLDTCVKTNNLFCQFNQDEIINPSGDHRRQTLFFCGQNKKICMPFNSVTAMQKAKQTVDEDFAVVGTWEDTNITLAVLEHYIPKFFKHAKVVYYMDREKLSMVNKNAGKRPVSQETRDILSKNLTNEIEFYEFCKQRLYLQYGAISKFKSIDNDDYVLVPEHNEDEEIFNQDY
ncbi:heparan sulfate 2-O-sulfotransferase pipe-like [Anastrepha ludens]|uniref:heparan sulfate 2-O-sulfotransferase pipe-like n=1 Tax=Anastrepha ludens TaxID=28586 RepID=UPI0023AF95B9|nr:heparan sulfate 2-O-sulfotransferase pipe-like [Anastrepha ludens]